MSKASWLWPYCCRKGAEWPNLQQCKLTVKEGSTATWHTTMQITSEGREHSNLTHNIAHCDADRCWKGAKRPDRQHYLQLHRLVVRRKQSNLSWLGKTAKSLSIFFFFSFLFFYLGLTTQREVWESVTSQVLHSHDHMTGSHGITSHDVTWWVTW